MMVDMKVLIEEIFGFLVFVFKFEIEEDVICFVNDSDYGFVGYFYFCDLLCVFCVVEVMEIGMVGVNIGLILIEVVLFGGVK